jgi:opacity protein-like surface antigen
VRLHSSGVGLILSFLLAAGCAAAQAQTTVVLNGLGAFTNSTNPGNSDFYRVSPAATAGRLLEFRHIYHPRLGWEGSYSLRRANEVYDELIFYPAPAPCPVNSCLGPKPYTVPDYAREFTADWIASGHIPSLRPFALLGVGLLLNHPVSSANGNTDTTQPAFDYGAGLDWGFARQVGLRVQYRGDLYKAPAVAPPNDTNPTIGFMNTSEPALGVYNKF